MRKCAGCGRWRLAVELRAIFVVGRILVHGYLNLLPNTLRKAFNVCMLALYNK